MADADDFESAEGTSDTTVTYKYCQIVVPNYKFDVSSSDASAPAFTTDEGAEGTRVTSGSSFLRLGSFPELTATSPSGLGNSVTLAKLVGNPDELAAYADAVDASAGDDGVFTEDEAEDAYKGAAGFMLGYCDDTRVRKSDDEAYIAGQKVTNTNAARKQETKRLLSKGGWWDHSDGNRVSTTTGDKVEVIQGNYKLLVLGRKDPSDGAEELEGKATVADYSGGARMCEGMKPEVVCVEYAEKDGVWSIVSKEKANSTEILIGKKFEYFKGSEIKSFIGQDPGELDIGHIDKGHDAYDPEITEKTWAKSISEYRGSDGKPVETIFELTHAKAITATTFAAAVNEVTIAAEITDTKTGLFIDTVLGGMIEIDFPVKIELIGGKYEYIYHKHVTAEEEDEATALETRLVGFETNIKAVSNLAVGMHRSLSGEVNKIASSVTTLNGQWTGIQQTQTQLSQSVTQLSNDVECLAFTGHHFF